MSLLLQFAPWMLMTGKLESRFEQRSLLVTRKAFEPCPRRMSLVRKQVHGREKRTEAGVEFLALEPV